MAAFNSASTTRQDTNQVDGDRASKPSLGLIFLTVFVELVGFALIIPVLPTYAQQLHALPTVIGLLVASSLFVPFIFSPFWGPLSDKVGRRPILLVSL